MSVEWLSESYRLRCALRQRGWSRVPRLRRQASRLRAATRSLDRCPQKREQVDKATGPAATERLGGGAEKFGREKENRARSEHIAIILAEAVVIWGSRLRPSLRYESKTTTNGGETGEANPHSCKAGRNLGSDCRAVGHGAAASSSRPACCS